MKKELIHVLRNIVCSFLIIMIAFTTANCINYKINLYNAINIIWMINLYSWIYLLEFTLLYTVIFELIEVNMEYILSMNYASTNVVLIITFLFFSIISMNLFIKCSICLFMFVIFILFNIKKRLFK